MSITIAERPTDTNSVLARTAAGTSGATFDATEQAAWTTAPDGAVVNYPARYNAAFLRQRSVNASTQYGPRPARRLDGVHETAAQLEGLWSIDFDWYTVAGALEVPIYNTGQLRFIVDGQYASATPTVVAQNCAWQ